METEQNPEFMEDWLKFHHALPLGWLHHYTTPDGLLGIVRSKTIIGTHYRFLNDSLELVWGKEVVAQHPADYIARAENRTTHRKASRSEDPAYFAGGLVAFLIPTGTRKNLM
jgi:hypothetical protein